MYMTDLDGNLLKELSTPVPFRFVAGISCDAAGNFLVANCKAHEIQVRQTDNDSH